jgi:D-inositol-3-phosphate glycosyltransferase
MLITLLPIGGTPHYELGLLSGLLSAGIKVEVIGNDVIAQHELSRNSNVRFFNLREDQNPDRSFISKVRGIVRFYSLLVWYALTTKSELFHIQWENRFLLFDRTVLIAFYKLLGKKIVYTAHNINGEARDARDSAINRLSLRFLYTTVDHLIVHTEQMKKELIADFEVSSERISVIPMGLGSGLKRSTLTQTSARQRLGILPEKKVLLFFGSIECYKGLDVLIKGLSVLTKRDPNYQLIIAGKPKPEFDFRKEIVPIIEQHGLKDHLLVRIGFIPEEEIETYFMASDCSVLPYRRIYQSAVFFLSYAFGLPILASDVGSFRENTIQGRTGFTFAPQDPNSLANTIEKFFGSKLYHTLESRRAIIEIWASKRFSWKRAGRLTSSLYDKVMRGHG